MKSLWTKMLAAALALTMLMSVLPLLNGVGTAAYAVGSYGKTTDKNVNLRVKSATSADYLFRMPEGWVCTVLDTVKSGGKTWYKVRTTEPGASSERTHIGYVLGDFMRMLTEEEAIAWEKNPQQYYNPNATEVPGYTSGMTLGQITKDGVNFREGPSTRSASLFKVDKGIVMEVLAVPTAVDDDPWYRVKYEGKTGYIQGPYLRVIYSGVTPTPAPTAEPAPTAPVITDAPTTAPTATPVPGANGYIKTTIGKVNFRQTTGGTVVAHVDKDVAFEVTGATIKRSGYTWYPVVYQGMAGYLRSDVVKSISKEEYEKQNATPTPAPETATPAPTATPDPAEPTPTAAPTATDAPVVTATPSPTAVPSDLSNHVITILEGKTNLRVAATKDSSSKAQVDKGAILEITGTTTTGGALWYRVSYKGAVRYILGSCVRQMTVAEYNAAMGIVTPTPVPVNPTSFVMTTVDALNVRSKANGSNILGRIKAKGTVLECFGTEKVGTTTWYYVKTEFGMGYITGKYAVVTTDPSVTPTPVPDPTATPDPAQPTVTPDPAQPTATTAPTATPAPTQAVYSTLKLGSTGDAVKRLTTALKEQGYFSGAITSTYTTAVQTAVKNFQKAKGLVVDGIAGQATQQELFNGSTPVVPGEMKLYKAEKIDWYTGGINELWARGDNYQIFDVYTKTVWWAHRWAGGDHADIEPLTAADTAVLCAAYGVSTAKEIATKDLWQRRPCLVTIGSRTFACSLYGEPHGTQTILDNNFPGQCCLHFTNSKTHGTKQVNSYHTAAIQYAWEYGQQFAPAK